MNLKYIQKCRACGNPHLKTVLDLGHMHLQGAFIKGGKHSPPCRTVPNTLLQCDVTKQEDACGLVQTSVSVPPEILYSSYWYRSGISKTMRDWLQYIADETQKYVSELNFKPSILDIAANDLTGLKCYPSRYRKLGIDPSDIVLDAQKQNPDIQVINGLFPESMLHWSLGEKFDIISSIAVFYDIEDPVEFATAIQRLLKKNGVWVFEVAYLPTMMARCSYDSICAEHIEHYSLSSIEWIVKKAGLKLLKAEKTMTNGGSILCFAAHADSEIKCHEGLKKLRQEEFDLALDSDFPFTAFKTNVNHHRIELFKLLKEITEKGETIHLYGASTKMNTIIEWCGIKQFIQYAAERSEEKWGAKTLNGISIISEADSRRMQPNYYLVGPYHFKDEILARETETINNGTKFIFPLPEISIVG